MERGIKLMLRGPSGRLITDIIRRSITFNPRGLKVPPGRVQREISSTLGTISVCSCHRRTPFGLSNNRGRHVTVTKVLTVRPRYVILSRPATVLSPGNHSRMVAALLGLGHRGGVAIILVARCVRRTILTSEIIIVSTKGVLARNAPRRIFSRTRLLGGRHLSIPRTARLTCELEKYKIGFSGLPLGTRRYMGVLRRILS